MSFKINIVKKIATATFTNIVEENEITNAFLDIVGYINIKKLGFIVLDFSDITSYSIPKNYMDTLKMVTHFSTTWNKDINVVVIATNPEIRIVVENIIEHHNQIRWKYFLFEDFKTAKNTFKEI